jgi:hypothetical protein
MKSASFWLVSGLVVSLGGFVRAADINDPNIFNPTNGPDATAASTSTYGGDLAQYAVDTGTGYNQFFFGDYQGSTSDEELSIAGFSAPSGIATLRFFDAEEYEDGRVATSVVIYASSTDYAGNAGALTNGNYTALNGGAAYNLPLGGNNGNGHGNVYYSTGVDSAGDNGTWGHYDDLSVAVPAGTQSLLFDFQTNGIGKGFTEIQGFAAVPEPSTYAMMFAGLVALGFCLRRRLRIA